MGEYWRGEKERVYGEEAVDKQELGGVQIVDAKEAVIRIERVEPGEIPESNELPEKESMNAIP